MTACLSALHPEVVGVNAKQMQWEWLIPYGNAKSLTERTEKRGKSDAQMALVNRET